ncbi:HlyD family type I secretion periplasmic adaptor subunit [Roseococcus sp. YIM B11640]|uniref:HlyD family type I secretion periplasmic adaptor subunit n=1 Tax=Roseococcus sp. YIM B11640 TaxID=3133973 RepID=UPI003C7DDA8C
MTGMDTRAPLLVGVATLVLGFGGFMAWSAFAPLSEAALAPGTIRVEGTRRTLQHLEGGMVREILVRDGDRVRAGQVVMRLDDQQSGAAMQAALAQRLALAAQAARLAAELSGGEAPDFPAELAASADPRDQEAMAGQRAVFQARRASLDSQLAVFRTREEQARGTVAAAEGQRAATMRQLQLIRQEEAMRRDLLRQGLSRLPELLSLQRSVAAAEGGIADLDGQIHRAQSAAEEARTQARATIDQRLQETSTEARDVGARLAEADQRWRAATDVSTRREIVAPEDGTIVNLRVFNLGAVLKPGDPAMDLVPERDRLVAEVRIQPGDIDVVHPGLRADLRLPAFRQRLVPLLDGEVTFVAADATTDPQTQASHYRAQIRLDPAQVARLPVPGLVPGMPVEAHVKLGERSFWTYITQPLRDSFSRAFREP